MIQLKNETDDLLLSITKICEKLIEDTHTKAQETLEFKIIKRFISIHQLKLKKIGWLD